MTEPASLSLAAEPLLLPTEAYLVPSLPVIWFGVVVFALTMYVALDGFDFGIGMLYATRSNDHERETLLSAFGPVWDANEVWLVAFGTMLLAAFPRVYSRLLSEHYVIVMAFVLALLFRGVGPELLEQHEGERWQQACELSFVAGSTLAPFFLGTLAAGWLFAVPLVSLPAVLTGVGVVALSVVTGSAFVAAKTDPDFAASIARYGQIATVVYLGGVLALLGVVALRNAGGVAGIILSLPVFAVVGASASAGGAGIAFASRGRYRAWLIAAFSLPILLGALVAVVLYPVLYPATGLTVEAAVVSPLALNLTTVLGLPVLVVVLWYFKFLYSVFGGPIEADGYGQ
jgi:cytochrome d ubiquinol oxidase subunit II